MFAIFLFYYQLVFLFWFVLIGLLVGGTFIILLKQNLGRTVFGELVGILGLTMTAPLAHSVAIGRIQPIGFYVWGLSFLYFASSIFYVKATVQDFVTARARARMAASRATAEGVLRPLPFLQSSERVNPILTRSHIARDASGSGDSPATDELLSTASLILSHPHAAFGCPLPMGERLGVRGQSKNNDTHAAFMSPCIDFKEPYESFSKRQLCQVYHWGLLTLAGILVISGKLPILILLAFAPVIVRGLWDSDIPQMRLNLRRIGWLEVAYSIILHYS